MKFITRCLSLLFVAAAALFSAAPASAQQTECAGTATKVKAVSLADYQKVKALFQFPDFAQFPDGNLQQLLSTDVTVDGPGRSCLVATFSAMALPSDNYMVFQVRVDGVPMEGHLSSAGTVATPVVVVAEETDMNQPKMVSYTFFKTVGPGPHRVEVMVAAGSGPGPFEPAVGSPVLVLKYK
jgi:hypothetical protein